ncbi:MAG: hypothetical protein D4R64_11540 [Porphyromonadaceae bacterium]|nr:MAG: hypothetical protein D4R64_11540 [Porphyromonadaceae bacterium]
MWTKSESDFIYQFKKPYDIQLFLDSIPYNPNAECRSPRLVIADKKAHCFEGALFGVAMLRELGFKPLILDLMAENDDDHVIAVFKIRNKWGAIAKSNTTALRYREPVYISIRELIMSYFDFYFNTLGDKSLRSYSRPVNLSRFDHKNWSQTDSDLEYIGDYLTGIPHYPLLDTESIKQLQRADQKLMDAVFLGANADGLFKPEE